jgi:hypothetical protein
LLPALQRVEQQLHAKPKQRVADGGFTSRENIVEMAAQGVDFIGSLPQPDRSSAGKLEQRGVSEAFYPQAFEYDPQQDADRCPAGQTLRPSGAVQRPGRVDHHYRTESGVCAACPCRSQCCPQNATQSRSITRTVEGPEVRQFIDKMATPEAKEIYRQRGPVAEFPHAWIKEKLGLRQFRLRRLSQVLLEVLWACLTYNIQQWTRLRWRLQRSGTSG